MKLLFAAANLSMAAWFISLGAHRVPLPVWLEYGPLAVLATFVLTILPRHFIIVRRDVVLSEALLGSSLMHGIHAGVCLIQAMRPSRPRGIIGGFVNAAYYLICCMPIIAFGVAIVRVGSAIIQPQGRP
jgi:predicted anti-sigma-YlaC factor YlaD